MEKPGAPLWRRSKVKNAASKSMQNGRGSFLAWEGAPAFGGGTVLRRAGVALRRADAARRRQPYAETAGIVPTSSLAIRRNSRGWAGFLMIRP